MKTHKLNLVTKAAEELLIVSSKPFKTGKSAELVLPVIIKLSSESTEESSWQTCESLGCRSQETLERGVTSNWFRFYRNWQSSE